MNEPTTQGTGQPPIDLLTRQFSLDGLVALRHDLEHSAAQHGLTGLELYRFVVAVNELTTNAVRHGGGSGHLALWRTGDRLHCRVTDRGNGMPPAIACTNRRPKPSADAASGSPATTSNTSRSTAMATAPASPSARASESAPSGMLRLSANEPPP